MVIFCGVERPGFAKNDKDLAMEVQPGNSLKVKLAP